MGFADAIPGVSGGTMALILGVYTRFITALTSLGPTLLKMLTQKAFWVALFDALRTEEPKTETEHESKAAGIAFLINLGVGILGGLLVGVAILPWLMDEFPESMRGFFYGLVLASIIVPYSLMKARKATHVVAFLITAIVTYGLMGMQQLVSGHAQTTVTVSTATGAPASEDLTFAEGSVHFAADTGQKKLRRETAFQPSGDLVIPKGETSIAVEVIATLSGERGNIQPGVLVQALAVKGKKRTVVDTITVKQAKEAKGGSNPALWYTGICGAIAICAMMLPGVSGSFLLLMLGLYGYILHELRALLYTLDANAALPVGVFILGILVGLIGFSRILKWLLERAHDTTMAVLAGLMLGSLRALWPYKAGVGHTEHNIIPEAINGDVLAPMATLVLGIIIVSALHKLGQSKKSAALGN